MGKEPQLTADRSCHPSRWGRSPDFYDPTSDACTDDNRGADANLCVVFDKLDQHYSRDVDKLGHGEDGVVVVVVNGTGIVDHFSSNKSRQHYHERYHVRCHGSSHLGSRRRGLSQGTVGRRQDRRRRRRRRCGDCPCRGGRLPLHAPALEPVAPAGF